MSNSKMEDCETYNCSQSARRSTHHGQNHSNQNSPKSYTTNYDNEEFYPEDEDDDININVNTNAGDGQGYYYENDGGGGDNDLDPDPDPDLEADQEEQEEAHDKFDDLDEEEQKKLEKTIFHKAMIGIGPYLVQKAASVLGASRSYSGDLSYLPKAPISISDLDHNSQNTKKFKFNNENNDHNYIDQVAADTDGDMDMDLDAEENDNKNDNIENDNDNDDKRNSKVKYQQQGKNKGKTHHQVQRSKTRTPERKINQRNAIPVQANKSRSHTITKGFQKLRIGAGDRDKDRERDRERERERDKGGGDRRNTHTRTCHSRGSRTGSTHHFKHQFQKGPGTRANNKSSSTSSLGRKLPSKSYNGYPQDSIGQRLASARRGQIKELKSKVTQLENLLKESRKENQTLTRMMHRHEVALSKYEGAEAELPKMIRSHVSEVRSLQENLRRAQGQNRNVDFMLKTRDQKIFRLEEENKTLITLVKQNNLEERSKLTEQLDQAIVEKKTVEAKLVDLQRHVEILEKNHRHQISVETKKLRATNNKLFNAHQEIDKLVMGLKEKDRILTCTRIRQGHMQAVGGGNRNDMPMGMFRDDLSIRSARTLPLKKSTRLNPMDQTPCDEERLRRQRSETCGPHNRKQAIRTKFSNVNNTSYFYDPSADVYEEYQYDQELSHSHNNNNMDNSRTTDNRRQNDSTVGQNQSQNPMNQNNIHGNNSNSPPPPNQPKAKGGGIGQNIHPQPVSPPSRSSFQTAPSHRSHPEEINSQRSCDYSSQSQRNTVQQQKIKQSILRGVNGPGTGTGTGTLTETATDYNDNDHDVENSPRLHLEDDEYYNFENVSVEDDTTYRPNTLFMDAMDSSCNVSSMGQSPLDSMRSVQKNLRPSSAGPKFKFRMQKKPQQNPMNNNLNPNSNFTPVPSHQNQNQNPGNGHGHLQRSEEAELSETMITSIQCPSDLGSPASNRPMNPNEAQSPSNVRHRGFSMKTQSTPAVTQNQNQIQHPHQNPGHQGQQVQNQKGGGGDGVMPEQNDPEPGFISQRPNYNEHQNNDNNNDNHHQVSENLLQEPNLAKNASNSHRSGRSSNKKSHRGKKLQRPASTSSSSSSTSGSSTSCSASVNDNDNESSDHDNDNNKNNNIHNNDEYKEPQNLHYKNEIDSSRSDYGKISSRHRHHQLPHQNIKSKSEATFCNQTETQRQSQCQSQGQSQDEKCSESEKNVPVIEAMFSKWKKNSKRNAFESNTTTTTMDDTNSNGINSLKEKQQRHDTPIPNINTKLEQNIQLGLQNLEEREEEKRKEALLLKMKEIDSNRKMTEREEREKEGEREKVSLSNPAYFNHDGKTYENPEIIGKPSSQIFKPTLYQPFFNSNSNNNNISSNNNNSGSGNHQQIETTTIPVQIQTVSSGRKIKEKIPPNLPWLNINKHPNTNEQEKNNNNNNSNNNNNMNSSCNTNRLLCNPGQDLGNNNTNNNGSSTTSTMSLSINGSRRQSSVCSNKSNNNNSALGNTNNSVKTQEAEVAEQQQQTGEGKPGLRMAHSSILEPRHTLPMFVQSPRDNFNTNINNGKSHSEIINDNNNNNYESQDNPRKKFTIGNITQSAVSSPMKNKFRSKMQTPNWK